MFPCTQAGVSADVVYVIMSFYGDYPLSTQPGKTIAEHDNASIEVMQ